MSVGFGNVLVLTALVADLLSTAIIGRLQRESPGYYGLGPGLMVWATVTLLSMILISSVSTTLRDVLAVISSPKYDAENNR